MEPPEPAVLSLPLRGPCISCARVRALSPHGFCEGCAAIYGPGGSKGLAGWVEDSSARALVAARTTPVYISLWEARLKQIEAAVDAAVARDPFPEPVRLPPEVDRGADRRPSFLPAFRAWMWWDEAFNAGNLDGD